MKNILFKDWKHTNLPKYRISKLLDSKLQVDEFWKTIPFVNTKHTVQNGTYQGRLSMNIFHSKYRKNQETRSKQSQYFPHDVEVSQKLAAFKERCYAQNKK